jgi:hypothetical protein
MALLPSLVFMAMLAVTWRLRVPLLEALELSHLLPPALEVTAPQGFGAPGGDQGAGEAPVPGARGDETLEPETGESDAAPEPLADPASEQDTTASDPVLEPAPILVDSTASAPREEASERSHRAAATTQSRPRQREPVSDPPELGELADVLAFEAAPHDAERLATLIDGLLEASADDQALELAVQSHEEGGAVGGLRDWSRRLDPHREAKARALLASAVIQLETAEEFLAREHWLNAGALLHGASALLEAITLETGWDAEQEPALEPDLASSLTRRDSLRAALWRPRNAVRALAQAGATLPDDVSTDSRLALARAKNVDERLAKRGTEYVETSRHFAVTTELGSLIAGRASDVLEAAYTAASERFGTDPLRRGGPLKVHILGEASSFQSTRRWLEPTPPAWPGAFREPEDGSLVVLDPRVDGGDLDGLWQLLARESARLVLAGVAPEKRELAPWLAWALALSFEGTRVLADGSVDVAAPPVGRRSQVSASFAGWGEHRPSVQQVLRMDDADERLAPWAWALLMFVREDDGGARWPDAEAALLDSYREQSSLSPEAEFRQHVLHAARARSAGLDEYPAFELAWVDWLEDWLAVERGLAFALDKQVERARDALQDRRWDVCRSLFERVRETAPGHAGGLAVACEWAGRRGRTDEALLAARLLASIRPDTDFRRFAELVALHEGSAVDLQRVQQSLRGPLADLARELAADGWPLAGLRLVDRALAAAPLDAALDSLRAELVAALGGDRAVVIRRRPAALRTVSDLHGEAFLWQPDAPGLRLRCADRAIPTTLRGITRLTAPCSVRIQLEFHPDEEGRLDDDGKRFIGLLFGADEAIDHGSWGVFVSPAGRLELASEGGLEWPSQLVGKTRRKTVNLTVSLWGDRITLNSPGKLPIVVPRGSRPADGWLALFGRRVDATIVELEVTRTRRSNPRAVWFTR